MRAGNYLHDTEAANDWSPISSGATVNCKLDMTTQPPVMRRLYPGSRLEVCYTHSARSKFVSYSNSAICSQLSRGHLNLWKNSIPPLRCKSTCSSSSGPIILMLNALSLSPKVWRVKYGSLSTWGELVLIKTVAVCAHIVYAYFRQVCLELSQLVVALEIDCTKENCPEMKADGWLYLCAAHPSTQSVTDSPSNWDITGYDLTVFISARQSIISFILWMVLQCCSTIQSIFQAGNNGSTNFWIYYWILLLRRISIPEPSLKHFQSIARRLYRIFAHAYFHHREIYQSFEVRLLWLQVLYCTLLTTRRLPEWNLALRTICTAFKKARVDTAEFIYYSRRKWFSTIRARGGRRWR